MEIAKVNRPFWLSRAFWVQCTKPYSFMSMRRMFRCFFLMTLLWHGVCEDSSCHLTVQRSPVTGGAAKMDGTVTRRTRVAILVAGTVARFHLNSSAEHLVAPLVQSGWEVDHFSSFFLGRVSGWHAAAEAFEADWEFQQANETQVESIISQKLSSSGARVIFNHVFSEQDVDLAESNFIEKEPRLWPFPRTKIARKNFILMWKNLSILWQKAKEQEEMYGKYSNVIIVRDDAYWFRDFNLTQMLELRGIERLPGRPGEGQLYSVKCDLAHFSGGDPGGLMDYFLLVDRVAADVFCTAYERLLQPTRFGDDWVRFRNTGFLSSERFYLQSANFTGIQVFEVPPGLLPFQRVGRLKGALCLHKYCDSQWSERGIPYLAPNLTICKDDHWWRAAGIRKKKKQTESKKQPFQKKNHLPNFSNFHFWGSMEVASSTDPKGYVTYVRSMVFYYLIALSLEGCGFMI